MGSTVGDISKIEIQRGCLFYLEEVQHLSIFRHTITRLPGTHSRVRCCIICSRFQSHTWVLAIHNKLIAQVNQKQNFLQDMSSMCCDDAGISELVPDIWGRGALSASNIQNDSLTFYFLFIRVPDIAFHVLSVRSLIVIILCRRRHSGH